MLLRGYHPRGVVVRQHCVQDNAHGAQRIPTYSRGTQTRERVEGAASDEEHEGEVMRGDGAGDDARASGVDQGAATTNSSLGSEPVRTSRMVHIQVKKPGTTRQVGSKKQRDVRESLRESVRESVQLAKRQRMSE